MNIYIIDMRIHISCPFLDIFRRRTSRFVRRRKITLVECSDLVRLEGTDNGMQQTPVVEQDEIVLFPVRYSFRREYIPKNIFKLANHVGIQA